MEQAGFLIDQIAWLTDLCREDCEHDGPGDCEFDLRMLIEKEFPYDTRRVDVIEKTLAGDWGIVLRVEDGHPGVFIRNAAGMWRVPLNEQQDAAVRAMADCERAGFG